MVYKIPYIVCEIFYMTGEIKYLFYPALDILDIHKISYILNVYILFNISDILFILEN